MEKKLAIERLNQCIEAISEVRRHKRLSPEYKKWKRDTEVAIRYIFGGDTVQLRDFSKISYSPGAISTFDPDSVFEERFHKGLDNAKATLQSMVDEVDKYWSDDLERNKDQKPETNTNKKILSKKDLESKKIPLIDIFKHYEVGKLTFPQLFHILSIPQITAIVVMLVAVCGAFYGWGSLNSSNSVESIAPERFNEINSLGQEVLDKNKEFIDLSPAEIYAKISQGETLIQQQDIARKLFIGKYLNISLEIGEVVEQDGGKGAIFSDSIFAVFDNREDLLSLKKGMKIKINGKIKVSNYGQLILEECEIVDIE